MGDFLSLLGHRNSEIIIVVSESLPQLLLFLCLTHRPMESLLNKIFYFKEKMTSKRRGSSALKQLNRLVPGELRRSFQRRVAETEPSPRPHSKSSRSFTTEVTANNRNRDNSRRPLSPSSHNSTSFHEVVR